MERQGRYLTEEVLDRQSVEVRGFLLETSVLDRVSGALCDAVTGRTDSQVMLERVERANLFLVPLDEVRGWWRHHHLFADLLRARLQRQQPERIAVLHRNAAASTITQWQAAARGGGPGPVSRSQAARAADRARTGDIETAGSG